ncbi:histidine phosphatase family protein [Tahibacter amnicola]|uniref:Histidine phosphatase family protein n=1 Tax=Tahibacter amnicola TaxID=2976241 RepID=A0ABY6BAU1_9GAMM|nr:histidine phosphatase family protein [Tahibacter amnicola]UXI66646.1 histidine phosphatase family protein [Tahibacter amnicola]
MATEKPALALLACRHGHSVGNAARADALQRGLLEIDSPLSDAQFPLTGYGRLQADALGRTIAALPASERPTRIICSPHLRALETADGIIRQLPGVRMDFSLDARLRPKSFGVLERLTDLGVQHRFPHLAAQRKEIGRFHFCPPGGESRCDVVLRVRECLREWQSRAGEERILLVTHQVVINALDFLLGSNRANAMATDADGWVPNAQIFRYRLGEAAMADTVRLVRDIPVAA